MLRDFEAVIDKSKNVTFENPSIGEEVDTRLYMGVEFYRRVNNLVLNFYQIIEVIFFMITVCLLPS